jgi:3'(2'), 5'-bisphosphate nucleotidase
LTDPCRYLDGVRAIAIEAGRRILDVYERDFDVAAKADGSPLTAADRAAQDVIAAGLGRLAPDVPLLSEESAMVAFEERRAWARFWLADPLDGTKEFVSRNGEFTVNIALIEAGRPVLGVVYVPVLGLTYYACRGQGAFKHKGAEAPRVLRARTRPEARPIVATSRSHPGAFLAAFLARIGAHHTVSMGSSLKFCLVAEGAADLYPRLGPTMEWDTAAAQCVVEEAGGVVVDRDGRALAYNKPDLHNPWFVAGGPAAGEWLKHLPPEA